MQTSLRSSYQNYYDYASCGQEASINTHIAAGKELFGHIPRDSNQEILVEQQQAHLNHQDNNNHEGILNLEELSKYGGQSQLESAYEQQRSARLADPPSTCYLEQASQVHQQQPGYLMAAGHASQQQQTAYRSAQEPAGYQQHYQPEEDHQASYQALYYELTPFAATAGGQNQNQSQLTDECQALPVGQEQRLEFANGHFLLEPRSQQYFEQYESSQAANGSGSLEYEQQQPAGAPLVGYQQPMGAEQEAANCQMGLSNPINRCELAAEPLKVISCPLAHDQHHQHHHQHQQYHYHSLAGHPASLQASALPLASSLSPDGEPSSPASSSEEFEEEEEEEEEEEDGEEGCSRSESRSQFSSGSSSSLSRDERRARCANIPLAYNEIVNLSIDQFNEQLGKHKLTESQLTLIKDIRRRGKNKVAAQSCRKRKMQLINELEREVAQLSAKRKALGSERGQLAREHKALVEEYDKVYALLQVQQ